MQHRTLDIRGLADLDDGRISLDASHLVSIDSPVQGQIADDLQKKIVILQSQESALLRRQSKSTWTSRHARNLRGVQKSLMRLRSKMTKQN